MNKSIAILAAGVMLAVSASSFAQVQNAAPTRAEVKAQVATAEQDGTLHSSKVHYPETTSEGSDNAGFGTATNGSSDIGSPAMGHSTINHSMTSGQPGTLFEHH